MCLSFIGLQELGRLHRSSFHSNCKRPDSGPTSLLSQFRWCLVALSQSIFFTSIPNVYRIARLAFSCFFSLGDSQVGAILQETRSINYGVLTILHCPSMAIVQEMVGLDATYAMFFHFSGNRLLFSNCPVHGNTFTAKIKVNVSAIVWQCELLGTRDCAPNKKSHTRSHFHFARSAPQNCRFTLFKCFTRNATPVGAENHFWGSEDRPCSDIIV